MKKYLITSPEFYTDTPSLFAQKLEVQIQKHRPDFVLLRDKETANYKALAIVFAEIMQKYPQSKAFVHDALDVACELGITGVHFSGKNFHSIQEAKAKNREVIISTHTQEEVKKAEVFGADYVTYSPIFSTPNKGEPKGVEDLEALLKMNSIKVFALGGIVHEKEVTQIAQTKVYGFASIRYFL